MKDDIMYLNPSNMRVPMHIPLFGINYCHANYHNIRDISEITVIGYVLAGHGTIQIDSLTFHPSKGGLFILPKGSYHKVSADPEQQENWTYIWLNMRGNSTRLIESYRLQSTYYVPDVQLEHVFRKAFDLAEEKPENEQYHIQLILIANEILFNLANILEKRKSLVSVKVQEMKQYLDEQGTDAFNSLHMSRHFAMSFKQINRLFKREIGTTVYNYLMIRKMKTAKMLLEDSEMSISEIAYYIGYADTHYFSNVFKRKTGVTPTEYRETNGSRFKK